MKRFLLLLITLTGFCIGVNAQITEAGAFEDYQVAVDELGINIEASDFGPCMVDGQLYYTTFSEESIEKGKRRPRKAFYDIFNVDLSSDGYVGDNQRSAINEFITQYHDGPVAWCSKTGELFVTRSNIEEPQINKRLVRDDYQIKLKILVAKKVNGSWQMVDEFPYNNSDYSVGHPAITENGDTLYFVSDMPGGLGETDIYRSVRSGNQWSEPVNLGANINTEGQEMTPALTSNGHLIFASNGRADSDSLDLYYTRLEDINNGSVYRFQSPINSDYDDFGMVTEPNLEYGFLTSNRPGTGGDDIYRVDLVAPEPLPSTLDILVLDAESNEPIPDASIMIMGLKELISDAAGHAKTEITPETKYHLEIGHDGYLNNTLSLTSPPGPIDMRDTVYLYKEKEIFVLKNINYDLDKWAILPESEIELHKLVKIMNDNPNIIVELRSHTDCRQTDAYNMRLSERRSNSARNYILTKGISAYRLVAGYYGESELLNHCDDGIICSDSEHRENRRTEFKVLSNKSPYATGN